MKITHSEKEAKPFANGRIGIEYRLVPENSKDQKFLTQLDGVLKKRPEFNNVREASIMFLGRQGPESKFSEYRIGIYEEGN